MTGVREPGLGGLTLPEPKSAKCSIHHIIASSVLMDSQSARCGLRWPVMANRTNPPIGPIILGFNSFVPIHSPQSAVLCAFCHFLLNIWVGRSVAVIFHRPTSPRLAIVEQYVRRQKASSGPSNDGSILDNKEGGRVSARNEDQVNRRVSRRVTNGSPALVW